MPWVVGIDEAGYGPNLGPLVQCAIGLRLPEDDLAGWETLKPWVRRAHEKDDGRLLIDDSKKVYAGAKGFERLERGARCGMLLHPGRLGVPKEPPRPLLVRDLFGWGTDVGLCEESWFDPEGLLPRDDAEYEKDFSQLLNILDFLDADSSHAKRVVLPSQFNLRLEETESKATILTDGLIELLRDAPGYGRSKECFKQDSVHFICDKQGGRNFYAPILQEAFPDGWVVAEREGAAESRYRITGLSREVTVVFRPKADGDSVCVALASMVCKYLREVCMMQFNAFWAKHVPGLKPTAGYPVDAKRFYAEIQPAMAKLGIPADAVWRKK